MPHIFSTKGVSDSDAPFLFRQLLPGVLLYCCVSQPVHANDCAASHIDERVRVVHVYDGDTVKLKDGRRLRFIGINTPETRNKSQSAQPFSRKAKTMLQKMINTHNHTLLLQAGREKQDHYGRLLAHVFLADGTNIAVQLLQKGLATTLVVPPNTWGHRCYQKHEDHARDKGRGLWGLDSHKPKGSNTLPPNSRGFHIIHGTVETVRQSRQSVWVSLEGSLVIHINKKNIVNFEPDFFENLAGQQVETRGWIKPVRGKLQMSVKHPAALTKFSTSIVNHAETFK